jgi:succinate dehydrogenase/fumarate reductase cytochrome b subunit
MRVNLFKLASAACEGLGIVCISSGRYYLGFSGIMAGLLINPNQLIWISSLSSVLRRIGFSTNWVYRAGILSIMGGSAVLLQAPVFAQFFQPAETFVAGFDGMDAGVVTLVFNSIRAIFIFYLLFGLVQVLNAVRKEEEWKDLAKTPLIVLLVGVLADILTGLISGVGGGGATT